MLVRSSTSAKQSLLRRSFSSGSVLERKFAILGAAGGIGQPLPSTISPTHLASRSHQHQILGCWIHGRYDELAEALAGADLVIIPAGVPMKPGMTRDDLFNINAGIVKNLCSAIAKYSPHAPVNIYMISNPVNSTVPIAAEMFKKAGMYDEKKLFVVTTLDVVRAKTFYAGKANVPVAEVNVPVIGGHAGVTILSLISQATPQANLSGDVLTALTKHTQRWSYAGALFADACLKGLKCVPDVVECSYVQSTITELPFFASKVRLGNNGVEEVLDLGPLSDFEKEGLEALKPELKSSIEKGVKFANQ
ncbi:hypothetical protein Bca4012_064789 [Brassica carinata]